MPCYPPDRTCRGVKHSREMKRRRSLSEEKADEKKRCGTQGAEGYEAMDVGDVCRYCTINSRHDSAVDNAIEIAMQDGICPRGRKGEVCWYMIEYTAMSLFFSFSFSSLPCRVSHLNQTLFRVKAPPILELKILTRPESAADIVGACVCRTL